MHPDDTPCHKTLVADLSDALIRLGLIAFLVILCARLFAPFLSLILWALILAVTLYPLHQMIAVRLGNRQGRAATLLVLAALVLIGVPTLLLGSSFVTFLQELHSQYENRSLVIPQPNPAVAAWPLIGESIDHYWSLAANSLPDLLEQLRPQLTSFSRSLLDIAASTLGGVLQFIGSLIIAGIMVAYAQPGSRAMLRIFERLAGAARGARLQALSTATVRSVASGVIGVAVIQALLLGSGFIVAEVPAAGLLTILVLLLGIAQLPALLVTLPVIGYLWWSGDSATANVIYTLYLIIAGSADNVLKPLLLGRGVDTPMPVILLGALGGMISGGIIGLFLGAVILALGYEIFVDWVDREQAQSGEDDAVADA
jgi:predicted PurR-regulated permease PerM